MNGKVDQGRTPASSQQSPSNASQPTDVKAKGLPLPRGIIFSNVVKTKESEAQKTPPYHHEELEDSYSKPMEMLRRTRIGVKQTLKALRKDPKTSTTLARIAETDYINKRGGAAGEAASASRQLGLASYTLHAGANLAKILTPAAAALAPPLAGATLSAAVGLTLAAQAAEASATVKIEKGEADGRLTNHHDNAQAQLYSLLGKLNSDNKLGLTQEELLAFSDRQAAKLVSIISKNVDKGRLHTNVLRTLYLSVIQAGFTVVTPFLNGSSGAVKGTTLGAPFSLGFAMREASIKAVESHLLGGRQFAEGAPQAGENELGAEQQNPYVTAEQAEAIKVQVQQYKKQFARALGNLVHSRSIAETTLALPSIDESTKSQQGDDELAAFQKRGEIKGAIKSMKLGRPNRTGDAQRVYSQKFSEYQSKINECDRKLALLNAQSTNANSAPQDDTLALLEQAKIKQVDLFRVFECQIINEKNFLFAIEANDTKRFGWTNTLLTAFAEYEDSLRLETASEDKALKKLDSRFRRLLKAIATGTEVSSLKALDSRKFAGSAAFIEKSFHLHQPWDTSVTFEIAEALYQELEGSTHTPYVRKKNPLFVGTDTSLWRPNDLDLLELSQERDSTVRQKLISDIEKKKEQLTQKTAFLDGSENAKSAVLVLHNLLHHPHNQDIRPFIRNDRVALATSEDAATAEYRDSDNHWSFHANRLVQSIEGVLAESHGQDKVQYAEAMVAMKNKPEIRTSAEQMLRLYQHTHTERFNKASDSTRDRIIDELIEQLTEHTVNSALSYIGQFTNPADSTNQRKTSLTLSLPILTSPERETFFNAVKGYLWSRQSHPDQDAASDSPSQNDQHDNFCDQFETTLGRVRNINKKFNVDDLEISGKSLNTIQSEATLLRAPEPAVRHDEITRNFVERKLIEFTDALGKGEPQKATLIADLVRYTDFREVAKDYFSKDHISQWNEAAQYCSGKILIDTKPSDKALTRQDEELKSFRSAYLKIQSGRSGGPLALAQMKTKLAEAVPFVLAKMQLMLGEEHGDLMEAEDLENLHKTQAHAKFSRWIEACENNQNPAPLEFSDNNELNLFKVGVRKALVDKFSVLNSHFPNDSSPNSSQDSSSTASSFSDQATESSAPSNRDLVMGFRSAIIGIDSTELSHALPQSAAQRLAKFTDQILNRATHIENTSPAPRPNPAGNRTQTPRVFAKKLQTTNAWDTTKLRGAAQALRKQPNNRDILRKEAYNAVQIYLNGEQDLSKYSYLKEDFIELAFEQLGQILPFSQGSNLSKAEIFSMKTFNQEMRKPEHRKMAIAQAHTDTQRKEQFDELTRNIAALIAKTRSKTSASKPGDTESSVNRLPFNGRVELSRYTSTLLRHAKTLGIIVHRAAMAIPHPAASYELSEQALQSLPSLLDNSSSPTSTPAPNANLSSLKSSLESLDQQYQVVNGYQAFRRYTTALANGAKQAEITGATGVNLEADVFQALRQILPGIESQSAWLSPELVLKEAKQQPWQKTVAQAKKFERLLQIAGRRGLSADGFQELADLSVILSHRAQQQLVNQWSPKNSANGRVTERQDLKNKSDAFSVLTRWATEQTPDLNEFTYLKGDNLFRETTINTLSTGYEIDPDSIQAELLNIKTENTTAYSLLQFARANTKEIKKQFAALLSTRDNLSETQKHSIPALLAVGIYLAQEELSAQAPEKRRELALAAFDRRNNAIKRGRADTKLYYPFEDYEQRVKEALIDRYRAGGRGDIARRLMRDGAPLTQPLSKNQRRASVKKATPQKRDQGNRFFTAPRRLVNRIRGTERQEQLKQNTAVNPSNVNTRSTVQSVNALIKEGLSEQVVLKRTKNWIPSSGLHRNAATQYLEKLNLTVRDNQFAEKATPEKKQPSDHYVFMRGVGLLGLLTSHKPVEYQQDFNSGYKKAINRAVENNHLQPSLSSDSEANPSSLSNPDVPEEVITKEIDDRARNNDSASLDSVSAPVEKEESPQDDLLNWKLPVNEQELQDGINKLDATFSKPSDFITSAFRSISAYFDPLKPVTDASQGTDPGNVQDSEEELKDDITDAFTKGNLDELIGSYINAMNSIPRTEEEWKKSVVNAKALMLKIAWTHSTQPTRKTR